MDPLWECLFRDLAARMDLDCWERSGLDGAGEEEHEEEKGKEERPLQPKERNPTLWDTKTPENRLHVDTHQKSLLILVFSASVSSLLGKSGRIPRRRRSNLNHCGVAGYGSQGFRVNLPIGFKKVLKS